MDPGKATSGDHEHRRLCNHRPARHSRRKTGKEAERSLRLADGLWMSHASDGGPGRADSGTAVTEELDIRR